MPEKYQRVIINFAGGWATDFGPAYVSAPQGNALSIPFLIRADNVFFELDGAPHKVGGTSKLNAAAISSGSNKVHGFYDYWKQGTAGTETQQLVVYAGTQLWKMDPSSGTTVSIGTGFEDNKQPCFEVFKDSIIWTSTSTVDQPQTWDQVAGSVSPLGGTPPKFSFLQRHKNRVWASGVASNPSRLYYSASLDATTWTGLDAGSIDLDPDDGDRIVGLASHKNELIVFKGPNRLSIHRITGSSPTGTDAFARIPFVTGVGGLNHNSIFRINDDVVFADPRGLHSLAATAAFGNYIEAFLSRPILSYYTDSLNHASGAINTIWGVNYQARGLAIWTVPTSSTVKDTCLVYDYRFQPGRWQRWQGYQNAHSLAIVQNASRQHKIYAGTTDGFVKQLNTVERSIDSGQAYTADVQLPFINFGSSAEGKGIDDAFVSIAPKGNYNLTLGWTADSQQQQTTPISQSGSDVLG